MAKHTVLIMGAGYGGLNTALQLDRLLGSGRGRGDVDLVLADNLDYHQLVVRLHEVAADSIEPEAAAISFGRLLNNHRVDFVQGSVSRIDMRRAEALIDGQSLPFDHLVFGLGSETDYFGIPGLHQHSLPLKSISDAKWMRSHLRRAVALGSREQDSDLRRAMLTFVVGGGGYTGTELAGELADWLPELARQHHLDPSELRLIVAEASGTLLAGFDPKLALKAQQVLERKGVELHLECPVTEATENEVKLKSGETIPTRTVVWTGGVRGVSLINETGMKIGAKNRAITNGYLESVGFAGVYVVGDSCLALDPCTKRPVAQSAQMAIEEAHTAAHNIYADLTGGRRVAFRPKTVGEIVSLGRRYAVADILGMTVTGYPGKLLKDLTLVHYLSSIGGWGLALQRFPETMGELVSQRPTTQEE